MSAGAGSARVERLCGRDRGVRVLSPRAAPAPSTGVETVRGDLARPEPEALDGVAGVVVGGEPPHDAVGGPVDRPGLLAALPADPEPARAR